MAMKFTSLVTSQIISGGSLTACASGGWVLSAFSKRPLKEGPQCRTEVRGRM